MELHSARDLFPSLKNQLYLNHAACSPFSLRVEATISDYVTTRAKNRVNDFKSDLRETKDLREDLANFINTDPTRIAFTSNTTHGLNIIASGIPWNSGDEVLLSDMEFPANVYPFLNLRNKGVTVRQIPSENGKITVDDFRKYATEKTRLISLSFVQYLNGYRASLQDIGDFCKENNILFVVDAIQGLGALEIDLQGFHCDALACGGHKWLMSPKGTGFLYLTKSLQEQLDMAYLGWISVENPFEFHNFNQQLHPDAKRLELATPNQIGIYGMHAAIQLSAEVGFEKITPHILEITDYLRKQLLEIGCEILTPFEDHERALLRNRVSISHRGNALRVSPHFYNNHEDMDRFVAALKKVR